MILVSDIYSDAKNIVGTCDEPTLFRRMTEAVEMLANKGDFDPLLGEMDICMSEANGKYCITLPFDIETVYAVNVNGRPSMGRDRWFNFHLNGPGDCGCAANCKHYWQDGAESPVFRELVNPSNLVAFVDKIEDANSSLFVYGYDTEGRWVRTQENGKWVDGYRVPTIFGFAVPESGAPVFARITRVKKQVTVGQIRLTSVDISDATGTLIGVYQYNETEPMYRRIFVDRKGCWARVAFRRRVFSITSDQDVIPLHSSFAILAAMRAMKAYSEDDVNLGQAHEATADRWISEEQSSRTPPVMMPMQFADGGNGVVNNADYID